MVFTPYTHTIPTSEIKNIEDLGFTFEGSSTPPAPSINTNFPNFDLLSILDTINTDLARTTGSNFIRKYSLKREIRLGCGEPNGPSAQRSDSGQETVS